ncbi:MAG: hypothetical protein R3C12_19340 [Planctomycetaceae bacterium]
MVLEADLELTASGSIDFNGNLSGDARAQIADNCRYHRPDLRGGRPSLATLDLTATDTITFESTLDDITTVDLTATTTRFEGDLTGLSGRLVADVDCRPVPPWPPPDLPGRGTGGGSGTDRQRHAPDFIDSCPATRAESLTIVSVTDLTFAAAVRISIP